jgi:Family of unknown function (DUF6328)
MLTGRHLKPETVRWASRLTLLGLALLVCTMAAALLLVLRVAGSDTAATWFVGGDGGLLRRGLVRVASSISKNSV